MPDYNLFNTGDPRWDLFFRGGVEENPDYNPNTIKGRNQPKTRINWDMDNLPESPNSILARSRAVQHRTIAGGESGLSIEEYEKDLNRGIFRGNPVFDDEKALNEVRAMRQSAGRKWLNFAGQALIGEVAIGTLKGVFEIGDGLYNVVTNGTGLRDDSGAYKDPITQWFQEQQDKLNESLKIYRRNPNASFDVTDLGWYLENGVSVFSTISLMFPAAGWVKAVGTIGKLTRVNKLFNYASKGISAGVRTMAPGIMAGGERASKGFANLIYQAGNSPAKVEKSINDFLSLTGQTVFSRAGENMQEAKQVYNEVYDNSLFAINDMTDEDFAQFVTDHNEFKGKSKEQIADEIARKSANVTFNNDWWMLLQDALMYRNLRNIYRVASGNYTSAAVRIAQKRMKQKMMGVETKKLIENNAWNRFKEHISFGIKNPLKSLEASEISEGFEEFYQGMQQEKGFETAAQYFDPTAVPRTLDSYIRDPSQWEQFVWGMIGGIAFPHVYGGASEQYTKLKAKYKVKTGHFSKEQYEAAIMTRDKVVLAQLAGFEAQSKVFLDRMENLGKNKNPFAYVKDPITGKKIYNEDGSIKYEELNENQRASLIEDAIDAFLTSHTLDAVDNGTYSILRELVGSKEFDTYLKSQHIELSGLDEQLSSQVVRRMDDISNMYYEELKKVNDIASDVNPFVNKIVARSIVYNKLEIAEFDRTLNSIAKRISELLSSSDKTENDYSAYVRGQFIKEIHKEIEKYENERKSIEKQFKDKKIGRTAYQNLTRDLLGKHDALFALLDEVTGESVYKNAVLNFNNGKNSKSLSRIYSEYNGKQGEKGIEDFYDTIKKIQDQYKEILGNIEKHDTPKGELRQQYLDRIELEINRAVQQAQLPSTAKEYRDAYDEVAYSGDETAKRRLTSYINQLKNFLESASSLEEFDARWKQFLDETGLKGEMKDAAHALKFGYWQQNANGTVSLTAEIKKRQIEAIYETLRKQKSERINADKKNEKDTGLQTPDGISAEDAQKAGATEKQEKDDDKQKNKEDKQKDKEDKQKKEEQIDKAVKREEEDAKKEQEQQLAKSRMSKIRYEIKKSIQKSLEAGKNASDMRDTALADVMRFLENSTDKRFATLFASDASYFSKIYDSVIDELNAFKQRQEGKRVLYNGESTDLGKAVLDAGFGETIEDSEKSFNAETETADSNVEEAEKQRIKKVIEHFLDLYASAIKSVPTNDGKHIINLDMLFRHLMRNSRRVSDRQSQNEVEEFFKINNQPLDAAFIADIYNNLAKYIAQFGGEKFVFTGLDKRYKTLPDFDTFVNALKENWAQSESNTKNVHMFPMRDSERSEDFADAVFFAARGIDAKGKPVKVEVQQSKSDGCLYVTVSYTNSNGEKKKNVKIGFFRATTMSETNDKYIPAGNFYGLQNRMVLGKDGKYHLEYESLFMEIINQTERGKALLQSLVDFYTKLTALREKYENSNDDVGYNKELNELMSDSELESIINNSLIQELYQKDMLRDNPNASKRTNAMNAMNAIANILLYGQSFNTNSPVSQIVNNLSSNSADMNERFQQWTQKLEQNYRQGAELQKAIEEGKVITPSVRVGYNTHLNTVEKGEQRTNIADTVLGPEDPGLNAPNCKLVYVKNGQFVDEDGNVLDGKPARGIDDNSCGIIIWDNNGVRYVAYLGEEVDLENGSYLKEAVREEVADMIKTQLQNIVGVNGITHDSHGTTFDNLRKKMRQLFNLSHNNLFKFYSGPGQCDVFVDGAADFINVKINDNGETIPLFSFYRHGRNGVGENNAINMLCIDKDGNIERNADGKPKYVMINGVVDGKIMSIDKKRSNDKDCTDYYNRAIDRALQHLRLNKSSELFKKDSNFKETKGNQSRVIVKIGDTALTYKSGRQKGQPITYRSYKEMMIQNRAFTTNVKRGRSGNMVDATINYGNITLSTGVVDVQKQSVSDLCFSKERPRRSTVSMRELVRAADPTLESQVEVMERLGFAKTIHLDHQDVSENTPLMKTEIERKNGKTHTKIYITARGAAEMNNNGLSAIRLIVHENLHSQLAHIDPIRKQRILNDVEQVYNYIIGTGDIAGVIDTEEGISKLNEEVRSAIKRVFDKVSSKYANNRNVGLEEFLVECMSQPAIAQWLNQVEWTGEDEANASNVKKKTVLQKILEFVMNLFETDTNKNINDGSTLARLYSIVGQQNGPVIGNNVSPDTNLNQETKETSPNELSENEETKPVIEETGENETIEDDENIMAETETVPIDFDRTVSQIDASIALSNQTRNSLNKEQASNRRFENIGNMATYISSYMYDFQNMISEMIDEGEIEYSCAI